MAEEVACKGGRRRRHRGGAPGDPFAVLGPHLTPDGWAMRAFVPDAISVRR